jgi:hypothetical protein
MDCGAILNESEDGRRLRAGCPGFKAERYAPGSCEHCHHDAQYHYDFLRSRLAEAEAEISKWRKSFAGHVYVTNEKYAELSGSSQRLAEAERLLLEAVDIVESCHDCIRMNAPALHARINTYLSRKEGEPFK